jgi:hypothetical protein
MQKATQNWAVTKKLDPTQQKWVFPFLFSVTIKSEAETFKTLIEATAGN